MFIKNQILMLVVVTFASHAFAAGGAVRGSGIVREGVRNTLDSNGGATSKTGRADLGAEKHTIETGAAGAAARNETVGASRRAVENQRRNNLTDLRAASQFSVMLSETMKNKADIFRFVNKDNADPVLTRDFNGAMQDILSDLKKARATGDVEQLGKVNDIFKHLKQAIDMVESGKNGKEWSRKSIVQIAKLMARAKSPADITRIKALAQTLSLRLSEVMNAQKSEEGRITSELPGYHNVLEDAVNAVSKEGKSVSEALDAAYNKLADGDKERFKKIKECMEAGI